MAHRSTKFDYAGPLLKYGLSSARLSTTARPPRDESKETAVDERALGRILIAVGDKFIPASLNGVALWTAIKKAAQDKDTFDRFRSGPRTRAIIKAMNGIRKAADALMSVVKENADAAQLMANTVSDPLMIIQQVIDCSVYYERSLTSSNNDLREKYDRIPSPTEWLVGVELPNIFEEFFAREARSRRAVCRRNIFHLNGRRHSVTLQIRHRLCGAQLADLSMPTARQGARL